MQRGCPFLSDVHRGQVEQFSDCLIGGGLKRGSTKIWCLCGFLQISRLCVRIAPGVLICGGKYSLHPCIWWFKPAFFAGFFLSGATRCNPVQFSTVVMRNFYPPQCSGEFLSDHFRKSYWDWCDQFVHDPGCIILKFMV